jgi:hypothetical protein
LRDI